MPSKLGLVVRNYAPAWFVVSMGTGGLSIVLHQLPYQFRGLHTLSTVFFVLNLVIFVCALVLYMARWAVAPRATAALVLHDHTEAPYLAAIVIAFSTLVAMLALVCAGPWGHGWAVLAYVLWWIAAVLSMVVATVLPFVIVRYHKVSTEGLGLVNSLTPVVLLIPIAPLTAATTGGIVCLNAGVSARLQVPVLVLSWWLVGAGLLLALTLYVLYLVRLMARNVLPLAQAPAALIAIGPLGQAATALLLLGAAAAKGAFAEHARGTFVTAAAAQSVLATSVLVAALLQGFALFWGLFAVLELAEAVVHHHRRTGRFADGYTLAWWSLVFPISVNTTALIQLAMVMDSPFFRVLATVVMFVLLLLWIGNAVMTLKGVFTGKIFGLTGGWRQRNLPLLPEKRTDESGANSNARTHA